MASKKEKPAVAVTGNTFKYVSFTEQISRLNTDTISNTLAVSGRELSHETYFYEAITKWNDMDYGDDYKAFLDDIPTAELATYAQLLFYRDQIAEAFNEHLLLPDSKAYISLLDILVAFVRDLKDDCFDYLWSFFDTLIELLEKNRNNVDVLESGFRTLAILFQLHWRNVVKNIRKAYIRFSPLFTSNLHYIRRFAAEAFSYLLRKSPSIPKLCVFLYEQAHESGNKHVKDGVAQLLFNGVKGVYKQFHSKTEVLMRDFVESALDLEDANIRNTAMEILVNVMKLCCQHGKVESSKDVTAVILALIKEQIHRKNAETKIGFLLNLMMVWLVDRRGLNFGHPIELFDALLAVTKKDDLAKLDYVCLELTSKLLLTYTSRFTDPAVVRQLILGVAKNFLKPIDLASVSCVFGFFSTLVSLNIFDIWIVSSVADLILHLFNDVELTDDYLKPIVKFFACYCLERRPFCDELNEPRQMFIDITKFTKLRNLISLKLQSLGSLDSELAINCLIVYPWLWRSTEKAAGIEDLKSFFYAQVANETPSYMDTLLTYLAIYDLMFMGTDALESQKVSDVLKFAEARNCGDEVVLRSILLLLTKANDLKMVDNLEYLEKFAKALKICFISPSGRVRSMAIKIMLIFDQKLSHGEHNEEGKFVEGDSVFSILLNVEQTPVTIHDYRQRGALLRRIDCKQFKKMLPENCSETLYQYPLIISLGQLFEKFTLYWPLVHDVVLSFAHAMPVHLFWETYQWAIDLATNKVVKGEAGVVEELFDVSHLPFNRIPTGDYHSFRIQIFKILGLFVDIAERKNKLLVDTLINIYRDEYLVVRPNAWKTVDISKKQSDPEIVEEDEAEDEPVEEGAEESEDVVKGQEEEKAEEQIVSRNQLQSKQIRRKNAVNTLSALLKVFCRFSSPKSLSREPELKRMYLEMLQSDNVELQRCSFACIVSYRYPFLSSYAENLKNFFDPKKFRDELALFSINENTGIVDASHRPELMPLVMKILYGCLMTSVTTRASARRFAIFNFVGACDAAEIKAFLDVLFNSLLEHFDSITKVSLPEFCKSVLKNYDLTNTLSPRRLKSLLNNLHDVVKRITPSLNDDQCHFIFRMLLAIGLLILLALDNEDRIEKFEIGMFRALRTQFFNTFGVLLDCFKNLKFTNDEINCLFNFIVEPLLISYNNSYSGTTLILSGAIAHFFVAITRLPMFYGLLTKPFSKSLNNESALSLLFNLLNTDQCDGPMRNQIVGGIASLLSLADEQSVIPIPKNGLLKPREGLNLGTEMVLSQLSKVIEFLVNIIPTDVAAGGKQLSLAYLDILNRLSNYVEDRKVGEHFASTLLSYVEKGKVRSEEKATPILQTVARMVRFVEHPKDFLSRLPKLLTNVDLRAPREALIDTVIALANHERLKDEKLLVDNLATLAELESWDRSRIEEPDFERRHKALAELDRIYEGNDVELDPLNLIFFCRSHAYTIQVATDLSLRSASASALRALLSYAARIYGENSEIRKELLSRHFLPLVTHGIRSGIEPVRNEFIQAVAVLVKEFGQYEQRTLKPLQQLLNSDADMDFFVNAVHIQLHRRQRALKRLAAQLASDSVTIPNNTLMKFIHPIIKPYLTATAPKLSAITAESLNLLTEILRKASWSRYFSMLEFYVAGLNAAENSKPLVRVIVAVVNAFHFDIVGCDFKATEFVMARAPKKDKRTLGRALRHKIPNEDEPVEPSPEDGSADEEEPVILENQRLESKKILEAVLTHVLPKLQDCIRPSSKKIGHKKSQTGKYYSEDEDLKRAPVALATVKLLQKLPEWVLNQHLHNAVLTLVSLLLSRSVEVRGAARKTLLHVTQSLGVKYIPFLLKELKQIMTKGFQVHVMIFSMHSIIQAMEDQLKTGDLDACVDLIVQVCHQEQFTDTTDEKELTASVMEAKANKTGETYYYLGKFISCDLLPKVVNPMKETFASKPTSVTMKKLSGLLRSLTNGLRANAGILPHDLLNFTLSVLDEHVAEMTRVVAANQPAINAEETLRQNAYRPESCLLIPNAPKRIGAIVKSSIKTQSSIFLEFGINLLANMLKAKLLDPTNAENVKALDPFLKIVLDCLRLKYEKVTGVSLRCLHGLLKINVPSIENLKTDIVERLFVVLADYAGLAGNKSTQQLSQNLFKCFNYMINVDQAAVLTPKRLQILLNYVEADVLDIQRQATAFLLLRTILSKKVKDDKISQMMTYFSEIAITSQSANLRAHSRDVLQYYVKIYHVPVEEKQKWLTFFLDQLEYEFEDGRLSALEMISLLISVFDEETNTNFVLLMLIKLAARLVNDESAKCVRFVQMTLQSLLKSVDDKGRNEVITVAMDWFTSDNESTNIIAMKVICEICRSVPNVLTSKVSELLSILAKLFCDFPTEGFSENLVLGVLETMAVMCQHLPAAFLKYLVKIGQANDFLSKLNDFLRCVLSKSVQSGASRLLGQLLGILKTDEPKKEVLAYRKLFTSKVGWLEFIYSMCFQLKGDGIDDVGAEQLVKNLVFLALQLQDNKEFDSFLLRAAKVCSKEVVHFEAESVRRKAMFKLTAAIALKVETEKVLMLTQRMLPHLHREMSGKSNKDKEELQTLANEVSQILKEKLGSKPFSELLIECSKKATDKVAKRKQEQMELAVTNPMAAANVKRRKTERKLASRKRKLDQLKPIRAIKRRQKEAFLQKSQDAETQLFSAEED